MTYRHLVWHEHKLRDEIEPVKIVLSLVLRLCTGVFDTEFSGGPKSGSRNRSETTRNQRCSS